MVQKKKVISYFRLLSRGDFKIKRLQISKWMMILIKRAVTLYFGQISHPNKGFYKFGPLRTQCASSCLEIFVPSVVDIEFQTELIHSPCQRNPRRNISTLIIWKLSQTTTDIIPVPNSFLCWQSNKNNLLLDKRGQILSCPNACSHRRPLPTWSWHQRELSLPSKSHSEGKAHPSRPSTL